MEAFGIAPSADGPPRFCMGACVITDAERYTSLAERIDPASTVTLINRYFETLFRPVYERGGFVSDVKGDGLLAVWADAAPQAELRAQVCRACLEMSGRTVPPGSEQPGHGLSTRIGAYFGPIALARVGALAHYEYRAVGDTVNTASRLEQLNKLLGTRVLVSAALAAGLDEFLFRDLGEFALRGKRNPVQVFELFALRDAASPRQRQLCEGFAAALEAQRSGHWVEALARWQALCARYPEDGPARYAQRRCQHAPAARLRSSFASPPFMPGLPSFALNQSSPEA